ncbi:MAG TPA: hypothetical protein VLZ74_04590 [Methylocella sp.]|nr:hypothetical protein [Methylocella sp.]
MERGEFEEIRASAHLPNLDIEIIHGRSADGHAERLSISVLAVPSFEAFSRAMEAANPFLFWMRFAQRAWAPWLGSMPVSLPPKPPGRLPPPAEMAASESATKAGDIAPKI